MRSELIQFSQRMDYLRAVQVTRQGPSILHLYTQNIANTFVLMRKMLTVFQGYVIL